MLPQSRCRRLQVCPGNDRGRSFLDAGQLSGNRTFVDLLGLLTGIQRHGKSASQYSIWHGGFDVSLRSAGEVLCGLTVRKHTAIACRPRLLNAAVTQTQCREELRYKYSPT